MCGFCLVQQAVTILGYSDQLLSWFGTGSRGLPSEQELKLLEPIRELVPPRVFTEEYKPQPYGGTGWHRDKLVKAAQLLKEAGWQVEDGDLIHEKTREKFNVRLLAVSPALGGGFIPFTRVIKRLGITSSIKSPEISNWLYRMRSGDFDIGAIWFLPSMTPTRDVTNMFSSATADQEYSSNYPNMRDPAVDHLINAMYAAHLGGVRGCHARTGQSVTLEFLFYSRHVQGGFCIWLVG